MAKVIMAYHTVFDNPHGDVVLEDLAFRCFENNTTIVHDNPHTSAFNEGRRSILLTIRRMLATKKPTKGIER
jgi:hypothetical protein